MKRLAGAVLLATLSACTSGGGDVGPASVTTTAPADSTIEVTVVFPDQELGPHIGEVDGRVLDASGAVVAVFTFESGWDLADDDDWTAGAERTSAPTSIQVSLPAAGVHRFELSEFVVSGSPCGTCEASFAGGTVETDVADGATVVLDAGESTGVS